MGLNLLFELDNEYFVRFFIVGLFWIIDLYGAWKLKVLELVLPKIIELVHKARIRFGSVPFLSNKFKSQVDRPFVFYHQIRTNNSCRSWYSRMTMNQNIMAFRSWFVDEEFSFSEIKCNRKFVIVSYGQDFVVLYTVV